MERAWNIREQAVRIPVGRVLLDGNLALPQRPKGIVLFAHGSGSSRFSPRNQFVARVLQEGGIATLLMDLLTPEEEAVDLSTAYLRFDIDLLAERLIHTAEWLALESATKGLAVGYFGASTGAGAALVAAARRADLVAAVVSRGGRPDLAGEELERVAAPTLLIVGGDDVPVIPLNEKALRRLHGETKMEIVPGATHLFEEPGTLEAVAQLACEWFQRYLHPSGSSSATMCETIAGAP